MKYNKKIEKSFGEVGEILGMKKEEIRMVLKHRKNPIIMGIVIFVAAIFIGNLNIFLGKRYISVSPLDFEFFNRFPFSFLF